MLNTKKNNLRNIKTIGVFTFLLIFVSCKSDKPEINKEVTVATSNNSVYITNEGNFQFGNASVSFYNPSKNEVMEDIFQTKNHRSLGDVCQSITYFNGKYYIILNNSHKIEIVDANTFQSVGVINGFNSPRYMLPINDSKAYVTDLYNNSISIVNISSYEISGYIPCTGWSEAIILSSGNVFVSNPYRNKVYVVNPQNDQITDSIPSAFGGNSLVEDKNGKIWVLCAGNGSLDGGLFQINPTTKLTEKSFSFTPDTNPSRLKINRTKDTLYWINKAIYKMPITSNSVPTSPFIDIPTINFYGLGIDPNTNEIYTSDAIDYVQKGVIYRFNSQGILINSFRAGIIPGDFYFN